METGPFRLDQLKASQANIVKVAKALSVILRGCRSSISFPPLLRLVRLELQIPSCPPGGEHAGWTNLQVDAHPVSRSLWQHYPPVIGEGNEAAERNEAAPQRLICRI